MEDPLATKGGFLTVERSLTGQLVDVRACHKGFFTGIRSE